MTTPVRSLNVVPPPRPPAPWRRIVGHPGGRIALGVAASPLVGLGAIGACRLLSWAAGVAYAEWSAFALFIGCAVTFGCVMASIISQVEF